MSGVRTCPLSSGTPGTMYYPDLATLSLITCHSLSQLDHETVYDKGTKTQEARNLLKDVGKPLPVTQEVLQQITTLTVRHIYSDKINHILGEARALKWGQMKRKSTSRIPPDPDSHNVIRVNYQVYIQVNYDKLNAPPDPTNYGWTSRQ